MRYAVLGGGMRFVHLVGMLKKEGSTAEGFFQEKAGGRSIPVREIGKYSLLIANWPMRFPLSDQEIDAREIMENIEAGSVLLLCGPQFPKNRRWDLQYVNLWADESLLRENAYLTAQGAVGMALKDQKIPLNEAECVVIGYGRIGQSLCEILSAAGARVAILSDTEKKRRQAREMGARAEPLAKAAELFPNCHYIFSTPPQTVLTDAQLAAVRKDALLMDLASPPYGFDLETAQRMGLNACREARVPDRCCPAEAARALYHAIRRWERVNHG